MSCCLQGVYAIFNCGCSGGKKPGCGYFCDMGCLKVITYHKLMNCRSGDGGYTASFPGPGSTALLKHADIVDEMQKMPAKWKAGEIYRGNDLGFIRLNPIFWPDVPDNAFSLALPAESHAWIRPIYDSLLGQNSGNWSADDIAASAGQYMDQVFADGGNFKIQNDVKKWGQILLHRLHMGIELTMEEAERFTYIQEKVLHSIVLPACMTCCLGGPLKSAEFLEYRKELLDKYKPVLKERHGLQPLENHLLASAMIDSLMFAGGLSVASVISCAMATIYSGNSPAKDLQLNEDTITPLIFETVRYYPAVVGFPWYDGPEQGQRRVMCLASALRDPEVWGDDANEFKLRDMSTYHQLSVGWADPAVDPEIPEYNRICPAKDLSIAMAAGFLSEWSARADQWSLVGDPSKIKIAGTTPFISNFEFSRNGNE